MRGKGRTKDTSSEENSMKGYLRLLKTIWNCLRSRGKKKKNSITRCQEEVEPEKETQGIERNQINVWCSRSYVRKAFFFFFF